MKITDIIYERVDAMEYFKKIFPTTPDYVIKDFIYPNYKHAPDQIEDDIVEWINSLSWQKKTVVLTLDSFDDFTKGRIQELLQSGNDERFRYQRDQIKRTNQVSAEPIIVTVDDGKFELQEGWHRTVESFRQWPDGYKQIAWIGT